MAGDGAPDVPVPPTIAALIAARLERLGDEDRTVLQEGSVIGLVFYERAVESMSPPELRPAVAVHRSASWCGASSFGPSRRCSWTRPRSGSIMR